MLFDWFTFIAQIVNFLILVWLLKRFLYKPILNAIDEREKRIATQMMDAETLKKEATIERDNYQHKNSEFDQQRQGLFNTAVSEANSERQKLLEQTRTEIENLRLRLQETLQSEQHNLSSEIMRRTRMEVFSIARKTLMDLASVKLEDQMTEVFIDRLIHQDKKEKELLLSAINSAIGETVVRSTFELDQIQQTAIKNMLKDSFRIDSALKFETAPRLVSGIELLSGGHKVVWSIDDYLVSLENRIAELISANKT